LRDGLQSLTKTEQDSYSTEKKIEVYNEIYTHYRPQNIEIGSNVSEKILPIFKDTVTLHKYIVHEQIKNADNYSNYKTDNYILIPNYQKLIETTKLNRFTHFSFIDSVSNSFQLKNTKRTMSENYEELTNIVYHLDNFFPNAFSYKTKLYVSCINNCPIDGKIDNNFIINRLLKLNHLSFDTICLSDTCGTLEPKDFEYIVDTCNRFGLPYSKLSLHLHVKPTREKEVEKIIHKALERKIINFDVSLLNTGGCSVTMNRETTSPNLSYDLYYKSLVNYITENST
jgi:isopropylmalate/homocitrate/citramalate synthase